MLGSNSEYNKQKARVDEVLKLGWAEIFQIISWLVQNTQASVHSQSAASSWLTLTKLNTTTTRTENKQECKTTTNIHRVPDNKRPL